MPTETAFADLGLPAELTAPLAALGYEEPTPIQRAAIPLVGEGHDVLGQAATGTGKTAAFALPILAALTSGAALPQALILVPARELAMQVSEAVHRYGRPLGTRVLPLYGGQPIGRQLRTLEAGVDVVVGTPGRVLDHIQRGSLELTELRHLVLDEADEMLDLGFADDLDAIVAATPDTRQTLLFSATLPARVRGLAQRYLQDPRSVRLDPTAAAPGETPAVRQTAYVVARAHKPATLGRLLDVEQPTAALVFCRTRDEVDRLTETLNGRGYRAEALHGGMAQEQRDRVMGRLRAGTAELLVATDVAARGLDVDLLTHVVNYDVPNDPQTYVHRIGRVGRAGRSGVALTLAEPREQRMLVAIERATGQRLPLESVPTVADLRARRLESTRAAVQARLQEESSEGDLAPFRVVLEGLAGEHDVWPVALAALAVAHEALGGSTDDDEDIPTPELRTGGDRRDGGHPDGGGRRSGARPGVASGRVFVGLGRAAGVRPQDLVGAITGETGLSGRDVGGIEIAERYSLVEVPIAAVDEVIAALRSTTIKGRRATVRRDRDSAGGRFPDPRAGSPSRVAARHRASGSRPASGPPRPRRG